MDTVIRVAAMLALAISFVAVVATGPWHKDLDDSDEILRATGATRGIACGRNTRPPKGCIPVPRTPVHG